MPIKRYVKKPVEIEALQYKGVKNFGEVLRFVTVGVFYEPMDDSLIIETLEGNMRASVDDYIIKGIDGEFYPCKPDIFIRTYEEI